jgi:hypothetical protein
MSVVKKEYMTIFDKCEPEAKYYLPQWFVNATPNYTKMIRVLGVTACYIIRPNTFDFPKNIRLCSNLTSDFPSDQSFIHPTIHPNYNFVMMVNNYNSAKEFDVTHSNLQYLSFEYDNELGGPFGSGEIMDIVIELELMIIS